MAEQAVAQERELSAAAMAADAVAADIDDIIKSDRSGNRGEGEATDAGSEAGAQAAEGTQQTFIVIKDIRGISRGRSLRLQADDLIVAIDGQAYLQDIETFLDIMFECDPETGKLLTIWRNGQLFNVKARGPLGCLLEHGKPEESEQAARAFASFTVDPPESYTTFEVVRDMFRGCLVIDTRLSPMAMIFPPLWLFQNRLWEVMIATLLIYMTTFAVHWALFVITYIILSIYFRKAHLVLRRSFAMMRGRHIWMVVAEKTELDTQRLCRRLDPKCTFTPDLIGPPTVDEKPKKRRRRR